MAINEASISRIRRFASQYNATHGRPPSPFQISAMLQGEIEADIAKQQQGRALALQSRSIDINESLGQQRIGLMERELSNQEKGAKMSGYGTAGMIGLIGAKELGLTKSIGEGIMKGAGSLWNVGKGIGTGNGPAVPTAGAAMTADMANYAFGGGAAVSTAGTIADTELGWTFAGDTAKNTGLFGDIWPEAGAEFNIPTCIIVTACTNRYSHEVEVARRYRDEQLRDDEYLGYYLIAPAVVSVIKHSRTAKKVVKRLLVDRLVDYGEWALGMKDRKPRALSVLVTKAFLAVCRAALHRTLRKEYAHA